MNTCRFCHFTITPTKLFAALIIIFMMACTNGKINLKPYYYPLDELLKEGKVYEYKSDNLNMASSFWYYKTILRNDTTYLVGQNISQLMEVEQKTVERKTGNGMVLHSNQIFLKDSTGKTNMYQVEVLEKSLFPFAVTDTNGIFLYKVKWHTDSLRHTTIIRNRRFIGFTEMTFDAKPIKCAKFELKELIEDFKDGYIEYPFHGVEYYGENIGLIKYVKIIREGIQLSYTLNKIYTVTEFEKKYRTKLENPVIY